MSVKRKVTVPTGSSSTELTYRVFHSAGRLPNDVYVARTPDPATLPLVDGGTMGPPDLPRLAEIRGSITRQKRATNEIVSVGLGLSGLGPELRICGRTFDSRGH